VLHRQSASVESSSNYVFFYLATPDDAHDLVRCLNTVCPAWTAFEPDGSWIVGIDVAWHRDALADAVRTASGWAAALGLPGLPLEYDSEEFFVPATADAAKERGRSRAARGAGVGPVAAVTKRLAAPPRRQTCRAASVPGRATGWCGAGSRAPGRRGSRRRPGP
jgi:hypothetical protein